MIEWLARRSVIAVLVATLPIGRAFADGIPAPVDWSVAVEGIGHEANQVPIVSAVELPDGRVVTVGFWLQSLSAGGSLRLRADGSLEALDQSAWRMFNVVALSNNDHVRWMGASGFDSGAIEYVDREGRLGWRLPCTLSVNCGGVFVGDDDEVIVLHYDEFWHGPRWWQAYDRNGATLWRTEAFDHRSPDDLAVQDHEAGLIYTLVNFALNDLPDSPRQIEVQAFNVADGSLAWRWQSPQQRGIGVRSFRELHGGGLVLAVAEPGAEAPQLRLLRLDPSGNASQSPPIARFGDSLAADVLLSGDGGGFIVHLWGPERPRVPVDPFSADGGVGTRFTVDMSQALTGIQDRWLLDRDGRLWAIHDAPTGLSLRLFSPSGVLVREATLSTAGTRLSPMLLLQRRDGRFLLIANAHGVNADTLVTGEATAILLDADGGEVSQTPFSTGSRIRHELQPTVALAPDGGAVVAFRPDTGSMTAQLFGTGGQRRWQRAFESEELPRGFRYELQVVACGEGRLCLETGAEQQVLDMAGGQTRAVLPSAHHVTALAEGGYSLVSTTQVQCGWGCLYRYGLTTVSASGDAQTHELNIAPYAVAADGSVISANDNGLELVRPDGARQQWNLHPFPVYFNPIYGSGRTTRPFLSSAVLADANRARVLMGGCDAAGCGGFAVADVLAGNISGSTPLAFPTGHKVEDWAFMPMHDGDHLLAIAHAPLAHGFYDPKALTVYRIAAEGGVVWQRRWSTGSRSPAAIHEVPAANALVLALPRPDAAVVTLTVLDADNGDLRNEWSLACAGDDCREWRVDVADDGSLVALGTSEQSLQLIKAGDLFQTPGSVVAQQAALSGPWYAPATSGQGFTLRILPHDDGGATLFMPWFTFANADGNDPDALRWYALQADVNAATREMTIPITQGVGGRFGVSAHQLRTVGMARLRFLSCQDGLLEYRFDEGENQGMAGSMAITRLLPTGHACELADGEVVPAQAQENPALSGTWYDPAQSGQGLEIQHLAASGGAPGALFGAWYTFDPADPENQPTDQHWFSLQSAQALPGGVGVRSTLYQTLGGRFDARATHNHARIGEVDLLPVACDRIELRYRFDTTTTAGAFRGRNGTIDLHRLGECPAP